IGALLMSTWGGPKLRIHGVLAGGAISFAIGDFLFAVGRSVPVWVFAAIFSTAFIPLISGSGLAIFQAKVARDVQGRIFAVRDVIQMSLMPLGFFLAGPLADRLFEPAMQPGGAFAASLGWLVGTGPGAGMGLMFVGTSLLGTLICLTGYLIPAVRRVEKDLPDAERQPA
ncbi:MAG TPA: MFS transporter, partial [Anaerolineaceae bacterium]|nr:MFS transporter [Anaerolineaceae bacterium]